MPALWSVAADGASTLPDAPVTLFGVVAVGVIGYQLYTQNQKNNAQNSNQQSSTPVFKPMSDEDLKAARMARMKRFDTGNKAD